MTVPIFLYAAELSIGPAEFGKEEDRVVAEPLGATRFGGKHTLGKIGNDRERSLILGHGDDANEPRNPRAASSRFHLAQHLFAALCIACAGTGVARRIHSGSAAERRHDEARIVRKDDFLREAAVVQRLSSGVFRKCRSGFVELRQVVEIWEWFDSNP